MNAYFYSDNDVQKGPATYEDLKKLNISKETLIWRDGMDNWEEAGKLPELIEIFSSPIIPTADETQQQNSSSSDTQKQDVGYAEIDNTKMFMHAFAFKGRARRSEFFIAYILFYVSMILASTMMDSFDDSGIVVFLGVIIIIGSIWFLLSEASRRCHDLGHNGLWQLIPYYGFWLLFQDSKAGSNEYGNNPKGNNFKPLY